MIVHEIQKFGAPLECVERPSPQPTGSEVVIQVRWCGVCHTDLHLSHGHYEMGDGRKMTLADRGVVPPIVLGHEIMGTLAAIGPDAPIAQDQIGKPFIVFPWIGCGQCSTCAAGDDNLCAKGRVLGVHRPGGYQQQILVPHPKYLIDATGLPEQLAATYACSGLTAYSALRKINREPANTRLLITGFGGVGQSAFQLAQALGYRDIGVVDNAAERCDAARKAGAGAAFQIGQPDSAAPAGYDAAIDFVGTNDTAAMALKSLTKGGTYVGVGIFGGVITISVTELVMRALRIVGSYVGSLRELHELVALARSGALQPIPIETVPFGDVNLAMARLERRDLKGRLVLDMQQ